MQINKKLFIILILFLSLFTFIVGCSSNSNNTSQTTEEIAEEEGSADKKDASTDITNYTEPVHVTMELNGGKKVELELYPDIAPKTVENFVKLAKEGFYDGLTFHRVIPGFMIQGGDPTATGTGGSEETIVGEFSNNGHENNLKHERGVISMARAQDNDSASSQFFIVLEDTPSLDGNYAAFGKVTSGMEEIDKIAETQTDENDKPLEDQVIEKVYVNE